MKNRCSKIDCGRPAHLSSPLCLGHYNEVEGEPISDDELATLWKQGALIVTDAPEGFHEALMEAIKND